MSFSLSLELLSYQKLPADQMLPGVDIQQSPSGEKQMVFTQNLLLAYSNQTSQVSPQPGSHSREGHRAEDHLARGEMASSPSLTASGAQSQVGCWRVENQGRLPGGGGM